MEVGEPPDPGLADDFEVNVEPWNLVMEVTEFTFKNIQSASFQNTTIQPPHWTSGDEWSQDWSSWSQHLNMPSSPYSLGAVVYLVDGKQSGAAEVEIKVRVDQSENVGGTGKLHGTIGDLVIEADCPTGAGEHTVTGKITKLPKAISWYHGPLLWSIDVDPPGVCIVLNKSVAELFFILGKPGRMYSKGVWIEALRFVCGRIGLTGLTAASDVAKRVTRYCHTNHGMVYDTVNGGATFMGGHMSGTFHLGAYMCRLATTLNCYDQAGAVSALAAAVGVIPTWIYLEPFGYITMTVLVGVGPCNTPFFTPWGTSALVSPHDPRRTSFGNHAFVALGKVLDACAGPHEASEDLDEYIQNSIDHDPWLYRRPGARPGTIFDALEACPGVTDVA